MKKIAIFAGVMVLGATVALASSLNVPFFLDRGAEDGAFPPVADEKTYVGIHNNLSVDLEVFVDYYDAGADGTVDQRTPLNNTFILPANSTFSFRPVANDPGTEGLAAQVPDMPNAPISPSTIVEVAGSCILTWVGGPADIQGRLVTVDSQGNAFSFLLPPGF